MVEEEASPLVALYHRFTSGHLHSVVITTEVIGMDAAHSRSESNKSDPDPKSNPNLNKALPPLPLELEFNQSPLRLVSHSGSFRTITSSACPTPGTRIGTRTGLPALTRPLPPASARAQSRPQPWKSRAATDNTFDFALEDLFDPDSPLQAKIARNTASRLITSTRELSLVVPTTTTRSMPDLVKDQAAERVPSPETEPEPESVNQLSRLLPRSLLSMKQLETGTNRNHAFNSMDMTTDMDIENLITDDDDNTDVVGVQRQINQKKPINLVDHDQSQKSHTHNNTSVDHIERIKDQAPPLSQPNSSPLPTPGATTTTQPPIIPTTAVNKKKIYNRLDSIDVANLNNSKPSQSTTPPASSSSLQQPTDVDTDMVPTTPSARDGRLSFGPGLSEDDLQRNAKVLASLARRVKKRVSN